jgi:hypothetical protein
LNHRMKSGIRIAALSCGLFANSAMALQSSVPVTWIVSPDQVPKPVLETFGEDCILSTDVTSFWKEGSEAGAFIVELKGKRQLFLISCGCGTNCVQSVILFDGRIARKLAFPVQDRNGKVTNYSNPYNSSYLGNGILMSVTSEECSLGDHMADYAILRGDKLLPFTPKEGRLVCAE